jgi:hypothetical protein
MLMRDTMKLRDALMHASLAAASGCTCPDGLVATTTFASWKSYRPLIDACIASDAACEQLCRTVLEHDLEMDMREVISIPKCVITGTDRTGVALAIEYIEPIDCGIGRRPTHFAPPARRRGVAAWLASVATLEAASVTAFARLARSLVRLGAPAALVAAARRAIADELVHAGAVGRLAHRFGVVVEAPRVDPCDEPSVAQLAIENAVEGQVGETFGALVAACQARAALDPGVRAAFAQIARDEARHAALAHQLAPWFERRSGLRDRDTVAAARQAAIARITTACDFALARDERELLGLPEPAHLQAAARQMFALLGANAIAE